MEGSIHRPRLNCYSASSLNAGTRRESRLHCFSNDGDSDGLLRNCQRTSVFEIYTPPTAEPIVSRPGLAARSPKRFVAVSFCGYWYFERPALVLVGAIPGHGELALFNQANVLERDRARAFASKRLRGPGKEERGPLRQEIS